MFQALKFWKMSGTWQIGAEMTQNGKMKLDICSHFSNHTRTQKNFKKKRNTKKQYSNHCQCSVNKNDCFKITAVPVIVSQGTNYAW